MKKFLPAIFGSLAIVIFFMTYWICCYYWPYYEILKYQAKGWWELRVIMDSWSYLFLCACIYFISENRLSVNIISIIGMEISGNDLIDRYMGDTHFKPVWDIVMLLLVAFTVYKKYKNAHT